MSKSFSVTAADGHVVHGTHWTVDSPKGALLLVHGITGDRHENGYYDLVAGQLQERDIATFAIDFRGHGESVLPISELMLSGVMLDIEVAWQFLMESYENCEARIISGASFGAGVSYLFGGKMTSVDGVVLTMPVLSYVDDLSRVNPAWRDDLQSGFINYEDRRLDRLLVPEMHFFDQLIDEAHCGKPVTILHGEADTDVPFQASLDFQRTHEGVLVIGLEEMDHGWTAPGDLRRETEQSWENQKVAASRTVEFVLDMIRVPVVARVPENADVWIKKALDIGCDGVIVPQVNTAEEARAAVASAKYPPLGARSVGYARAHRYGAGFLDYVSSANETTSVIVQIEHIDAVENAAAITAVEGIDAVLIGPYDLSGSMNLTGDLSHPKMQAAITRAFNACKEAQVPVAIFAGNADRAKSLLNEGYDFIAVGTDMSVLADAAGEIIERVS